MITITCKSRTNQIVDFHVEEIISIDGKPYTSEDDQRDISERLAQCEGAIQTILEMIKQQPIPA